MAKQTIITKLANGNVNIENDAQKYKLRSDATVLLYSKDAVIIEDGQARVTLKYTEVTTPATASAQELYDELITNYFFNPAGGGGGGGATEAKQDTQIGLETSIDNAVSLAPNSSTANVASSLTTVTLLSANANRRKAVIVNDGQEILLVKLGAAAAAGDYTYALVNVYDTLEIDSYTGIVTAVWISVSGVARVTEVTF